MNVVHVHKVVPQGVVVVVGGTTWCCISKDNVDVRYWKSSFLVPLEWLLDSNRKRSIAGHSPCCALDSCSSTHLASYGVNSFVQTSMSNRLTF